MTNKEQSMTDPVTHQQVSCTLTVAEVARIDKIAHAEDRNRGRQLARLVRAGLRAYDAEPAKEIS
jgi:hypothetical protein